MTSLLTTAIGNKVRDELGATDDKWVRLECPPYLPVPDALALVGPISRIGILSPFDASNFEGIAEEVSSTPAEITAWRNEAAVDRPTVVVGDAAGEEESGLEETTVVSLREIVDAWDEEIARELTGRGPEAQAAPLRAFFEYMLDEVRAGSVDPVDADDYVSAVFGVGESLIQACGRELWRLGLLPDERVMERSMASRLAENQRLVELVAYPPAGPTEERQLARIAASTSPEASVIREFQSDQDFSRLASVQLDDVRRLLRVERPGTSQTHRLLDFLSVEDADAGAALLEAITAAGSDIDLSAAKIEIEVPLRDDHGDLKFELKPSESEDWDLEEIEDGDSKFVVFDVFDVTSPTTAGMPAVQWTDVELIDAAAAQDQAEQVPQYEPLARSFIDARRQVARHARILDNDDEVVLEYLILSKAARDVLTEYISAWSQLMRAAVEAAEPPRHLWHVLSLLDAHWGIPNYDPEQASAPSWGTLAPFHPWRTEPMLKLANHAVANLGDSRLGHQLRWALDRCVPAYPVIWAGGSALTLTESRAGRATFERDSARSLLSASSGRGLVQVVRSFVAFHPYAKSGLNLVLVNPPPGGAVASAIGEIRRSVDRLFVRVVLTVTDTADLDGVDDVQFEGRFPRLEDWVSQSPAPSHISVAFSQTLPVGGAPLAAGHPTPGSFVALHISAERSGLGSHALRPHIRLDPREGNSVVLLQKDVASLIHGEQQLLNLSPSLPAADLAGLRAIAAHTEWLVAAVPGPVGVVAQAQVGDERVLIGRQDVGPYGLYVYALGAYAVRRYLAARVREAPLEFSPGELDQQIAALAGRSPHQMLSLGRSDQGQIDTIGMLAALQLDSEIPFAGSSEDDEFETFYISMDEVGWTAHWLADRFRSDLLRVDVARSAEAIPRVRIRAIEAKGVSGTAPARPGPNAAPWREARSQVQATLDSIASLVNGSNPDPFADLRFTAFCEHLFATAVARLIPLEAEHQPLLNNLSEFAKGNSPDDAVVFDGVAFATFYSSLEPWTALTLPPNDEQAYPITLIKASGSEVNALLTGRPPADLRWLRAGTIEEPRATPPPAEDTRGEQVVARPTAQPPTHVPEEPRPADAENHPVSEGSRMAADDLAARLFAACRRRGVQVGEPTTESVRGGPTLIAISLPLVPGSSIREIQGAAVDLAREIGIESLEVENDPARAMHVRFLMVRPDRLYPPLPTRTAVFASADAGAYLGLYVGQNAVGDDVHAYLSAWPHALVGGQTGSGKTTFLRSLLAQANRVSPSYLRSIVVDGKGETDYFGLLETDHFSPQFVGPQLEADAAYAVVNWLVQEEMPRRRGIIRARAESEGRPFDGRTDLIGAYHAESQPLFPALLVVIDEFGNLMLRGGAPKDAFESGIQQLGAVGRSVMIHLVLATQRPEIRIVPGSIKGNLPCRIALKLPSAADSITILGHGGAEHLAGRGDLLFEPPEGHDLRLQGYSLDAGA